MSIKTYLPLLALLVLFCSFELSNADKITDKKAQLCKKARALIETLKEDHKSLQERIKKETDAKKAALLKELDRILQVIQDKVQYYADKYFCNQNNLDLASLVKSLQHILH